MPPRQVNGGGAIRESEEEALNRISTEEALIFVEKYYKALQSQKSTISAFYVPAVPGDKTLPDITFNGNAIPNGAAVQEAFANQLPQARYDVQTVDCSLINPKYARPDGTLAKSLRNSISLAVIVGGQVQFGQEPNRTFSETFVLVPNFDPPPAPQRGGRQPARNDFLIQSQTFRMVALPAAAA